MTRWVMVALLAAVTACTARQVEVRTGPETGEAQAAVSLRVTNSLSQAVNVYVVSGGLETFVGQVAAQASQTLSVQGMTAGSSVTLRARQVDGARTYERPNVTLTAGTFDWRVP